MGHDLFTHGYTGDDHLNHVFRDRDRLPAWLRPLHILQTGLPDPRQGAPETTPVRVLVKDLAWLGGFATAAGMLAQAADIGGPVGILAAISSLYASLGVVGRLRRLVVGHTHEASHFVIAKFYRARGVEKADARRINETILDVGSALTITLNGLDYRAKHLAHHEMDKVGTLMDPDGMDLHAWGLWSGKNIRSIYRVLLARALDPIWHAGMIVSRLQSNFAVGTWKRRAMAAAAMLGVVGSAFLLPLPAWLMAIGLPWTIGYNVAALLQVSTEHPYAQETSAVTNAEHANRNWDRVPMEFLPDPALKGMAKLRAWASFVWRMAAIHVPSRLAVLDDSMIAHAWHHIAWPTGHRFNDWWETARRGLAARLSGQIPLDAAAPVVQGLPGALEAQQRRFAGTVITDKSRDGVDVDRGPV